jgi:hypothetical protein
MQSYTYYFLQPVQAAEINSSFTGVETAINRAYADLGMVGVLIGGSVNEYSTPNLTVDVSAAVVIDQTGQRIRWSSIQNVNCAVDENTISTAVGSPGNYKYLSLFAKFLRAPSDPRVDGERQTIYFNQAESFELRIAQGAEAVSPTPPALRSDQILLADILIDFGKTQIFDADIDMVTRRQWAITASSAALTIARGQIDDAFQDVADRFTAGTTDLADQTSPDDGVTLVGADTQTSGSFSVSQGTLKAQLLELLGHVDTVNTFAHSGNWHDGTDITATDVEGAINEVKDDLAVDTGNGGADKVGAGAQSAGGIGVTAGSIYDQVGEILTEIGILTRLSQMPRATNYDYVDSVMAASPAGLRANGWLAEIFPTTGVASGYVAIGDNGTGTVNVRYAQADKYNWATWTVPATTEQLKDGIFVGGKKYVFVGQIDSTSGAAILSADALNGAMTHRTAVGSLAGSGDIAQAIDYDSDSDRYIVVGDHGGINWSSDGITWTDRVTGPGSTENLIDVVANGLGDIIAVGTTDAGDGQAWRSTDGGNNWTKTYDNTGNGVHAVTWDPIEQRFWLCGDNGVGIRKSDSSAGSSWSSTDYAPNSANFLNIATDGKGVLVVTTVVSVNASADFGVTWAALELGESTGLNTPRDNSLEFVAGRFLLGEDSAIGAWFSHLYDGHSEQ